MLALTPLLLVVPGPALPAAEPVHSIGISSGVLLTSYASSPYGQPASVSVGYRFQPRVEIRGVAAGPVAAATVELAGFPRRDDTYGRSTMLVPRGELGLLWGFERAPRVSLLAALGAGLYVRRLSRNDKVRIARRPVLTAGVQASTGTDSPVLFDAGAGGLLFLDEEPVWALRLSVGVRYALGGGR